MIKNILYLAIFTTVVVVSWIGFTVYHNATTSTIPDATSINIEPITPSFDLETLQSLESRSKVLVDLSSGSPFNDPISSGSDSAVPELTPLPVDEDLELQTLESEALIETEVTEDTIPPADPSSDEGTQPAESL